MYTQFLTEKAISSATASLLLGLEFYTVRYFMDSWNEIKIRSGKNQ